MCHDPSNDIATSLDVDGWIGGGEWHAATEEQDGVDGLQQWQVCGVDVAAVDADVGEQVVFIYDISWLND